MTFPEQAHIFNQWLGAHKALIFKIVRAYGGMLVLLSMWEAGKAVWLTLIVALFFILVFWASGWELSMYKKKRLELEMLKKKLEEDVSH